MKKLKVSLLILIVLSLVLSFASCGFVSFNKDPKPFEVGAFEDMIKIYQENNNYTFKYFEKKNLDYKFTYYNDGKKDLLVENIAGSIVYNFDQNNKIYKQINTKNVWHQYEMPEKTSSFDVLEDCKKVLDASLYDYDEDKEIFTLKEDLKINDKLTFEKDKFILKLVDKADIVCEYDKIKFSFVDILMTQMPSIPECNHVIDLEDIKTVKPIKPEVKPINPDIKPHINNN